jgi:hypothetical protein
MLGSVRVSLVEARFGKSFATVLEAPLMIIAITLAARSVTAWFELAGCKVALLLLGVLEFLLAAIADFCVGLFLKELSFGEQVLSLPTPAGFIYLLLLALFAAMPLADDLWRSRA